MLGEALDLSPEKLQLLRVAGLLHDVGKIGIPDRILRKPGRLSAAEYEIVKGHSALGGMVIAALPNVEEVRAAVEAHHERYDGGGYPHSLAGGGIPLLARILAVADAYSAMTTDRPYRQGLSSAAALAELRSCAGSQFDPKLVELFIDQIGRSSEHGEAESALSGQPPALSRLR
jgi:HD-GYP domain-containing protein (c-di-GMP phosphodiesterase class II)